MQKRTIRLIIGISIFFIFGLLMDLEIIYPNKGEAILNEYHQVKKQDSINHQIIRIYSFEDVGMRHILNNAFVKLNDDKKYLLYCQNSLNGEVDIGIYEFIDIFDSVIKNSSCDTLLIRKTNGESRKYIIHETPPFPTEKKYIIIKNRIVDFFIKFQK
jgi:hypothetical protein